MLRMTAWATSEKMEWQYCGLMWLCMAQ